MTIFPRLRRALCLSLLLVCTAGVAADCPLISVGAGDTDDKPQSKLWHVGDTYWGIFLDGENSYFYKQEGDCLVKQSFPDALVDSRDSARADVLWNGTDLFVFLYHSSPTLLKYSYDAASETYSLLPGFPIGIPFLADGSETGVIDQDSTGKLWITYEGAGDINVIWSTSADHLSWNTSGVVLASGVKWDDISSVVAFDNKIGVFWSNQNSSRFSFRYHVDGDPENVWSSTETVASGSNIADDHLNLAVTDNEEVIAATKTRKTERIDLYIRRASGWEGPYVVGALGTRPIAVYDEENDEVYVFYSNKNVYPWTIVYKKAPLSDLAQITDAPEEHFVGPGTDRLRNVSSTKQAVNGLAGLCAVATDSGQTFYNCIGLSSYTAPQAIADATPTSGQVPLTVTFTGAGVDGDGAIVDYSWDFGDGGSSPEQSPIYTYNTPGTFVATLTVTDENGVTGEDSVTIDATPDPGADTDPPALSGQNPAPGAVGVVVSTRIETHVTDNGTFDTGVDLASIMMFVDGVEVVPSITGSAEDYFLEYTPPAPFAFSTVVTVRVVAQDLATPSNVLDETYDFTTADAPPPILAQINFQPGSTPVPAGCVGDFGEEYSSARGYGWDDGLPTKKRNVNPDPKLDTYVYTRNSSTVTWSIDVADGNYLVTLVVGSPAYTGVHTVAIHGTPVLTSAGTSPGEFIEVSDFPVTVTGGQLHVTLGGSGEGKKTKLCTLTIATP